MNEYEIKIKHFIKNLQPIQFYEHVTDNKKLGELITKKYVLSNIIHYCVIYEKIGIAEILINNFNVELNEEDAYGRTPLELAIRMNKYEFVNFLLRKIKCVINLQNMDGFESLKKKEVDKIKTYQKEIKFLKIFKPNNNSLIFLTTQTGNLDILILLIKWYMDHLMKNLGINMKKLDYNSLFESLFGNSSTVFNDICPLLWIVVNEKDDNGNTYKQLLNHYQSLYGNKAKSLPNFPFQQYFENYFDKISKLEKRPEESTESEMFPMMEDPIFLRTIQRQIPEVQEHSSQFKTNNNNKLESKSRKLVLAAKSTENLGKNISKRGRNIYNWLGKLFILDYLMFSPYASDMCMVLNALLFLLPVMVQLLSSIILFITSYYLLELLEYFQIFFNLFKFQIFLFSLIIFIIHWQIYFWRLQNKNFVNQIHQTPTTITITSYSSYTTFL
ncbi:hypothetical protein SNEBB_002594 [Seison nebaliae]|nr:hypothetical protein SNEBB_002594 [Seison nebaliae]